MTVVRGPIVMVSELSVCSSAVLKNMQLVIMARNSVAMQVPRNRIKIGVQDNLNLNHQSTQNCNVDNSNQGTQLRSKL